MSRCGRSISGFSRSGTESHTHPAAVVKVSSWGGWFKTGRVASATKSMVPDKCSNVATTNTVQEKRIIA
jgi:hypothetical protein